MEETFETESFDDLRYRTVELQNCFSSGNFDENIKWSLLKDYHSKFLLKENDNQIVTSYRTILSTLLDSLQSTLFSQKWQETVFDDVFLQGIHHEAFLILSKRLSENESYAQQKIINLLLKFAQGSSFEALFMYQCVSHKDWDLKYVSRTNFWDDLITAIISLPEKVANETKGKFMKLFSPSFYVPLLLSSIFKVLSMVHNRLTNSLDCSIEFLAKLCGRLCTIGNADIVAKTFSKEFIKVSEFDFVWRRISQNFITKMPSNSLDSFITNLLLVIPWFGYIEWILGDEGAKNEKLIYIMTVKLLFYCPFKQDIILQNTMGYFASSSGRVSHFKNILNSLLDSWMDEKTLRHQNSEQKIYIACAMMICAGWVKNLKLGFENKDCINKVLKGTQNRLGSSEETVRTLGMVVGEHFIKCIDCNSPPLKFEFTDVNLLNRLKNLLDIPSKPEKFSISSEDLKCFEEIEVVKSNKENDSLKNQNSHISHGNTELDSDDDDLEPYDMFSDISKQEPKRPFYIRECMMGLMEQENAEWAEQCMKHAEELIKANAYATEEVAEEMAKIVLHLNDNFAIVNFVPLRHRILIALTVQCPIVVAKYLTFQFAENDYNIRQRLDILEVLAASSALLSHSGSILPISETQPNVLKKHFHLKREASWKLIIDQRLEGKTKRYTKAQTSIFHENKFSAIAGNFFYPLLNSYDRACKILKLHGEDSYVLARFIHTLGIIMFSASNTLHCRQMGTALLQFLSAVKCHEDVFVRQSVIFAVAATYMSVPSPILLTDMLTEVTETNEWLKSVAQNDPEGDCVEKSLYALSIFQGTIDEASLLKHH